jgi:putative transposase
MIDDTARSAIALKKFSIISPIINGQVTSIGEYCAMAADNPIEMPHYGIRRYSPKTIASWYTDYIREGLDALKPKARADKGGTRKITSELEDILLRKRLDYPRAPITVIYDLLLSEGIITGSDLSLSTVTRFYNRAGKASIADEGQKELRRFSHENVNQLWQTDVMYGPYIRVNERKQQTYLMAYIDDSSRLITHAQFYLSQDILSLRHSFREALLKRGIPKLLYTDNGKIYRCQAFEYLCANIGVTLLRAEPYTPTSKGKIERFFRSCRLRFLSTLNANTLNDLDDLNDRFNKWLLEDYQKKPHSALDGLTPLEAFLRQSDRISLVSDLSVFNEKFLVKVERKIKQDATLSLHGSLYETAPSLAGARITVKYDPDELDHGISEVFLYREEKPVGTAKRVFFHDNAHIKRAGKARSEQNVTFPITLPEETDIPPVNAISYADMEVM